ncbi:hypothetical protein PsorP6_005223 [Peronosclerospora sorghi]|uniref:Uncharacterized protein n=1 Tax=Peronosclerospora sorghi TaxID=230839 RepID=A0ACC0W7L9_9STRA|nr:hypothetical protein PsorP6_005223 [Peronosclerospora sorghi]
MRSVATAGSIDDISVSTWVNGKMERNFCVVETNLCLRASVQVVPTSLRQMRTSVTPADMATCRPWTSICKTDSISRITFPDTDRSVWSLNPIAASDSKLLADSSFAVCMISSGHVTCGHDPILCRLWPARYASLHTVRDVEAALPGDYKSGRACLSLACPTRSYDDVYNIALWSEDVDGNIHATKYPQDIS